MRARLVRIALSAVVACVAAAGLAACGDTTNVRFATDLGTYLDLNKLKYQVELSRELNPYDNEDSTYLTGLTPAQRTLAPGEAWYGVFLAVFNRSNTTRLAASDFKITDTQGAVFTPLALPDTNVFAYRAGLVLPDAQIPAKGTPAYFLPPGGGLVLFKLKLSSFDNRPLVLSIVNPRDSAQVAQANLDL